MRNLLIVMSFCLAAMSFAAAKVTTPLNQEMLKNPRLQRWAFRAQQGMKLPKHIQQLMGQQTVLGKHMASRSGLTNTASCGALTAPPTSPQVFP